MVNLSLLIMKEGEKQGLWVLNDKDLETVLKENPEIPKKILGFFDYKLELKDLGMLFFGELDVDDLTPIRDRFEFDGFDLASDSSTNLSGGYIFYDSTKVRIYYPGYHPSGGDFAEFLYTILTYQVHHLIHSFDPNSNLLRRIPINEYISRSPFKEKYFQILMFRIYEPDHTV